MASFDQLYSIIHTIDTHLNEDLHIPSLAALLDMNDYQFCRVFSTLVGETPGAYIRARRLSEASRQLVESNQQIIYIAYDYGFESPEAFTRSFASRFHLSPKEYRKRGLRISTLERKAISKDELTHRTNNSLSLRPTVKSFPGDIIVGLKSHACTAHNTVPQLWQQLLSRENEICAAKRPALYYGICLPWSQEININTFTETTPYPVMVGKAVLSTDSFPQGMERYAIPAGTYAVFKHKGSLDTLHHTYNYIYGTWALSKGVKLTNRGDFELYDERFHPNNPNQSQIEIWISIE